VVFATRRASSLSGFPYTTLFRSDMYWGETNIVEVAVDPCKASYINGGSIAFTGPYNPSGANIITNSQLPSSPFASLGFEYVWLQSEVEVPNVAGNSNWRMVSGSE